MSAERFYINAHVFSTFWFMNRPILGSWLAADLTSRRPSGCLLKNFAFEIQPTLGNMD